MCSLLKDCQQPHPLYPRWKAVPYDDRSAVLEAGEALPAAGHGHLALRLGPSILSVEGVAYRTSWLQLENRVDTFRAKRVGAAQRFLLLNFVQANGAVFFTFTDYRRVTLRRVFHYVPVCDDNTLSFRVWMQVCLKLCDVEMRNMPLHHHWMIHLHVQGSGVNTDI